MAKTEKELTELKERLYALKEELKDLDEEELRQVSGGSWGKYAYCPMCRTVYNHDEYYRYGGFCPKDGRLLTLYII